MFNRVHANLLSLLIVCASEETASDIGKCQELEPIWCIDHEVSREQNVTKSVEKQGTHPSASQDWVFPLSFFMNQRLATKPIICTYLH